MTDDKELAYEFFHTFSRFEFALKACGFVKAEGKDRHASPDWDAFSNSINQYSVEGDESEDFVRSARYYLEAPPSKQIVKTGSVLGWVDRKCKHRDFRELLILLRRVRNNFFHGGKYPFRYIEGPERNPDLLKHGLVIMRKCLQLSPDVGSRFNETE